MTYLKTLVPYELEHDIRRDFSTVQDRVISAAIVSCRTSKSPTFYIPPAIAGSFGLTPRDITRTLDRLEGKLFVTVESQKGRYRRVRFLPPYVLED